MYALTTHFNQLRKNTLPPDERLEAARDLPPLVRKFLEELETLVTVWPHSRLAGSYAQKMCVGDVKDVDFLVFVSGEYEGENMISPRSMINSLKDALGGLAEALGYDKDAITVDGARRSVHIYFKDHDFHLDVVPCIAPNGLNEPVYVPCKFLKAWIESHPLGYIKLLDKVNAENGYNVKRLGRILKHFVQYKMKQKNMRPKSYWLGALLLQVIDDEGFDSSKSQAELFNWLVTAIYNKYLVTLNTSTTATPNLKDPVLGHNISWNWGRNAFEMFMARLKEARDWSAEAISEDTDRDRAIELWQKVFGAEFFPTSVADEAESLARALTPGRALVESTGRVVTRAAASVAAVPTIATRFHGGRIRMPRINGFGLPPAIQNVGVARHFPTFKASFGRGKVTWRGTLQPREGSPVYRVSVTYKPGWPPEVRVISPRLDPDAPHVYPGGLLCLYWPKDKNWNCHKSMAETIIPWTAQWLLFYELCKDTGRWLGPESPHRYPGKMERAV